MIKKFYNDTENSLSIENQIAMELDKDIVINRVIQRQKEIIEKLQKDIRIIDRGELGNQVHFQDAINTPIQRWFPYREGYSVELVKYFIELLNVKGLVFDPFCGSGTTLLAARLKNLSSIGIDINPISVMVAEVENDEYTENELNEFQKNIKNIRQMKKNEKIYKTDFELVDKVFNKEIFSSLMQIKEVIDNINNKKIKKLFLVEWLSIIESVSNVKKEGNGIKYKNRKRTPKGYINIDKEVWEKENFPENKFEYVKNSLLNKLEIVKADIEKLYGETNKIPKVYNGNCLEFDRYFDDEIEFTFFSPPYCNCFDYFEIHKVELWLGSFIKNKSQMKEMRNTGFRSNTNSIKDKKITYYNSSLEELISLFNYNKLWNKKIPDVVRGYFDDMHILLNKLYNKTKLNGYVGIVVGNSAYTGVIIPTDLIIARIAEEIGFKVDNIYVTRHLTTSSQQKAQLSEIKEFLRESVIILKKETSNKSSEVLEVKDRIPNEVEYNTILDIKTSKVTEYTHGFHKYPGKFIPQIPRWAIEKYLNENSNKVILDPFCGSGTTLVEGLLHGHNVIGVDIDPLSSLISKVKTTPLDISRLETIAKWILDNLESVQETFIPACETISHWFTDEAIIKLSKIRTLIDMVYINFGEQKEVKDIYDFLLICFSSIIRRVSNADNQSQKTYVSSTKPKTPDEVFSLFRCQLAMYIERIKLLNQCVDRKVKSNIICGNNKEDIPNKINFAKADIAITSPPYIKSVDYIYNQMVELFWIGDRFNMNTQKLQNDKKVNYTGTDKVFKKEYKEYSPQTQLIGIYELDSKLQEIFVNDKKNGHKHSYVTYKYFKDMEKHFKEIRKVLKSNSHYIMVVGDSTVSNVLFNTSDYLIKIAENNGFKLVNKWGYKIKNHYMRFDRKGKGGKIEIDWVIDLVNIS